MVGLGQAEAKSMELHPGLPCVAGAQAIGPSSVAFPGVLAGSWTGCRVAGTQISAQLT